MKILQKKVKQIFCNHTCQKCLTIIDSNYLYYLVSNRKIDKTVWECQRCGKIIYKQFKESPLSIINWMPPKIKESKDGA